MESHKYYSLLRPVSIGTYPKDGMIKFCNYDSRKRIPSIDRMAWGEIWYNRQLTDKEARSYDLEKENDMNYKLFETLANKKHAFVATFDLESTQEEIDAVNWGDIHEGDKILGGICTCVEIDKPTLYTVTAIPIRNFYGDMPFDVNGKHATGREVYTYFKEIDDWSWQPEYEGDDTEDLPATRPDRED